MVARRASPAIGAGLASGLANGLGIGVLKIPFFVVTLGTLSIYQSIALLTTNGETDLAVRVSDASTRSRR